MTLDAKSLDTKSVEGVCVGGCVRKLNRMVSAIYDGALANAGLKAKPVQRARFGRQSKAGSASGTDKASPVG